MSRLYWRGRRYTLVSRSDLTFLMRFKWHQDWKGYFITKDKMSPERRLHRLVALRAGKSLVKQIDHENRNKNDNRRGNLRSATHGQNRANSQRNSNNSSGLKGVHLKRKSSRCSHRKVRSDTMGDRWCAQINVDGKKIFLGYFDTKEQAHAAYKKAAKKYFRSFANP